LEAQIPIEHQGWRSAKRKAEDPRVMMTRRGKEGMDQSDQKKWWVRIGVKMAMKRIAFSPASRRGGICI